MFINFRRAGSVVRHSPLTLNPSSRPESSSVRTASGVVRSRSAVASTVNTTGNDDMAWMPPGEIPDTRSTRLRNLEYQNPDRESSTSQASFPSTVVLRGALAGDKGDYLPLSGDRP